MRACVCVFMSKMFVHFLFSSFVEHNAWFKQFGTILCSAEHLIYSESHGEKFHICSAKKKKKKQYLHSWAMRTAFSNVRLDQIYVALLACLFIMSCFDSLTCMKDNGKDFMISHVIFLLSTFSWKKTNKKTTTMNAWHYKYCVCIQSLIYIFLP